MGTFAVMRATESMYGKPVGEFTLRELVRPLYEILLICRHCQNATAIDPLKLIGVVGPDAKIETVRFKFRCTRCHQKRAVPMLRSVQDLPPMGPVGGGAKRA